MALAFRYYIVSIGFLPFILNQTTDTELYYCVDWDCKEYISLGKTLLSYTGKTEKHLSFKRNEDIKILGKPVDDSSPDWVGMVRERVGIVPKSMVREQQMSKLSSKYSYPLNILPVWTEWSSDQNQKDSNVTDEIVIDDEAEQQPEMSEEGTENEVVQVEGDNATGIQQNTSVPVEVKAEEQVSQEQEPQVNGTELKSDSEEGEGVKELKSEDLSAINEVEKDQGEEKEDEGTIPSSEQVKTEVSDSEKEGVTAEVEVTDGLQKQDQKTEEQEESVNEQDQEQEIKENEEVSDPDASSSSEQEPKLEENEDAKEPVEETRVESVSLIETEEDVVPQAIDSPEATTAGPSVPELSSESPVLEAIENPESTTAGPQKPTEQDQVVGDHNAHHEKQEIEQESKDLQNDEDSNNKTKDDLDADIGKENFDEAEVAEQKSEAEAVTTNMEPPESPVESSLEHATLVKVDNATRSPLIEGLEKDGEGGLSETVQEDSAQGQEDKKSIVAASEQEQPKEHKTPSEQVDIQSTGTSEPPTEEPKITEETLATPPPPTEELKNENEINDVNEVPPASTEEPPSQGFFSSFFSTPEVQVEEIPATTPSPPILAAPTTSPPVLEELSTPSTVITEPQAEIKEDQQSSARETNPLYNVNSLHTHEHHSHDHSHQHHHEHHSHDSHDYGHPHQHHHHANNEERNDTSSFMMAVRHLSYTLVSFLPEYLQETMLHADNALVFTGIIALTVICICVPYYIIEGFFSVRPLKKKVVELNKSLWKVSTAYENQQEEFDQYKKKALAYDEDKKRVEQLEYELMLLKKLEAKQKEQVTKYQKELKTHKELTVDMQSFLDKEVEKKKKVLEEKDKLKTTVGSLKEALRRTMDELQDHQTQASSTAMELELEKQSNETLNMKVGILDKEVNELKAKILSEVERRRGVEVELEEAGRSRSSLETELSDLRQICHKYEETVSALNTEINNKENELQAMQETLGEDSPLLDVAEIKAKLMNTEEQFASLQHKVDSLTLENGSLSKSLKESSGSLTSVQKERDEALNRLTVLEAWFKEKEEDLRKAVERYEAEKNIRGKDKDDLVRMLEEKSDEIRELQNKLEEFKTEYETTKEQHRNELRALESKSHETWLSLCQAERKAQDARKEAEMLRQKLTAITKEKDGEGVNGDAGATVYPLITPDMVPLPLPDDVPSYFGLGEGFVPPPPLPLDDEQPHRPAPLGRMSPMYSDLEDPTSPIRSGRDRHRNYSDRSSSESDSPRRRSPRGWAGHRDRRDHEDRHRRTGPLSTSSPIHGFNL